MCPYNDGIIAVEVLERMPIFVSHFTTVVIAVDRYVTIVHPYKYETQLMDVLVKWLIVAAWLVAGLLAGIIMYVIGIFHRKLGN